MTTDKGMLEANSDLLTVDCYGQERDMIYNCEWVCSETSSWDSDHFTVTLAMTSKAIQVCSWANWLGLQLQ